MHSSMNHFIKVVEKEKSPSVKKKKNVKNLS